MISSGSNQSQSRSEGFGGLPAELQNVFKQLASSVGGHLNNPQGIGKMFTPLGQTEGETQALSSINKGFAPDQAQLNSDINMQTNPFNSSVIDTINREAKGQNSILNQNLTKAGQFGSNRAALGANDIDLTRQNQIGTFQQGQFDKALNNSLTVLPQLRATSAQSQLAGGQFQRDLNTQGQQAPLNALARISQILGVLPTNSGQATGNSSGWNAGVQW